MGMSEVVAEGGFKETYDDLVKILGDLEGNHPAGDGTIPVELMQKLSRVEPHIEAMRQAYANENGAQDKPTASFDRMNAYYRSLTMNQPGRTKEFDQKQYDRVYNELRELLGTDKYTEIPVGTFELVEKVTSLIDKLRSLCPDVEDPVPFEAMNRQYAFVCRSNHPPESPSYTPTTPERTTEECDAEDWESVAKLAGHLCDLARYNKEKNMLISRRINIDSLIGRGRMSQSDGETEDNREELREEDGRLSNHASEVHAKRSGFEQALEYFAKQDVARFEIHWNDLSTMHVVIPRKKQKVEGTDSGTDSGP